MEGHLSLTFSEFEGLSSLATGSDCDGELFNSLRARGLVSRDAISEMGMEALEPYRVKRAVVLAAGFGSRMLPVTQVMPKPLARVNGVRIIDTVLDALVSAGIDDIIVVRGYMGEKFNELLIDYPGIRFVENRLYSAANNVSSVVAAGDYLAGSYVCEADLVLRKPELISPYQYRSNYLGAPVCITDDWCFKVDESLRIKELLVGGSDVHHMYGISYWTPSDGERLGRDAAAEFEKPGGNELYWDEIALRRFRGSYEVFVRECGIDDVIEIDTFNELVSIDPSYRSWAGLVS